MTTFLKPICSECIHAIDGGLERCTVFPDGIPEDILGSELDHRVPIDGDEGILFSPVEGSELTGDPKQKIPWLTIQPKQGGTP